MSGKRFDEAAQALYLALSVDTELTRAERARRCETTPETVRSLIKVGLDEHGNAMPGTFAEALFDLEAETVETVEGQLIKAAKDGQPWAVQMFLKARAKDVYAEKPGPLVQVNTQINMEGTPEERRKGVLALAATLDARAAVLELPSTEPDSRE